MEITPYSESFLYNGCEILVESNGPFYSDINFLLTRNPEEECNLILKELGEYDIFRKLKPGSKYRNAEYFQQTITSTPKRSGLGSTLHDFIIDNKGAFPFKLQNVYSTYKPEDDYDQTHDAFEFWKSRVSKGKAEFVHGLQRFRILWVSATLGNAMK